MTQLHDMTVAELAAGLEAKTFSATEVAQHFLARAQADVTGSFLAFNPEATLAQAQASDARIAAGTAGALEGVPLGHKDIFVTQDFPTTAGSKMLEGYRSPFDATLVRRLAEAGMVTVGKLNCDEFAMGSGNENSAYGSVKNPWDMARVPGGWPAKVSVWPVIWLIASSSSCGPKPKTTSAISSGATTPTSRRSRSRNATTSGRAGRPLATRCSARAGGEAGACVFSASTTARRRWPSCCCPSSW